MDCSLPASPVYGISQAKILEWVAMPSPPGDLPKPGTELSSLALAGRVFTMSHQTSPYRLTEDTVVLRFHRLNP